MSPRLAHMAAALLLGTLPLAASAYEALAAKDVHLRAGPARDYPVVAILPAGTPMDVQGCLPGYSWCDVIAAGERGWVYAANIVTTVQGAPVVVMDDGAALGIAILAFAFGDYWDHWYRDRPWYRDRDEWRHRPQPVRPPPSPHPPGAAPPHPLPPRANPAPPPHQQPPSMRHEPQRHEPQQHQAPVKPPPRNQPERPPGQERERPHR